MKNRAAICLYVSIAALLLSSASPALAQFRPRPLSDPTATGERYHIEGAASFWSPTSEMSIASEQFGILGSTINFKSDLGLETGRLRDLRVVLRPVRKHKLRFEVIPIRMSQQGFRIARDIVFNGQRYPISAQLDSTFEWNAYRFSYEYDFLARDRWYAGFIAEAKYTDVRAELRTSVIREYVRARGPLPAIGGTGRFYVAPNISITGEYTRIPVKEQITDDIRGRYSDLDIYGTVNFTSYVGAQLGYRTFDVGYKFEDDGGAFKLKGLYFGLVARY
jgi:hypothetical protein